MNLGDVVSKKVIETFSFPYSVLAAADN